MGLRIRMRMEVEGGMEHGSDESFWETEESMLQNSNTKGAGLVTGMCVLHLFPWISRVYVVSRDIHRYQLLAYPWILGMYHCVYP